MRGGKNGPSQILHEAQVEKERDRHNVSNSPYHAPDRAPSGALPCARYSERLRVLLLSFSPTRRARQKPITPVVPFQLSRGLAQITIAVVFLLSRPSRSHSPVLSPSALHAPSHPSSPDRTSCPQPQHRWRTESDRKVGCLRTPVVIQIPRAHAGDVQASMPAPPRCAVVTAIGCL